MVKKIKIMILGAGLSQLSAIQRAVDMGFYVITVDFLPKNIGHLFSHQSVNCSTMDQKGVLKAAKKHGIDGITTFASDVATFTVGFVAEQLELPGAPLGVAQTLSNKANFRAFQKKHRLNTPNFIIGRNFEDVENKIQALLPPLMFKPVDSSGSRGVSRLPKIDYKTCSKAFEYAKTYSFSKTVCVEEFIEGTEVGGDGFLVDGDIGFVAITHKHMNDYVVTGHSLPTNITSEDQKRVCAELVANCKAAGYTNGPFNFDVMVSPEQVTVIEMSPRLGGNGIPMIIERAMATDLISATLMYASRCPFELTPNYDTQWSCGSWIFGSNYAGILKNIVTKRELQNKIPEIFEYIVSYDIGNQVPWFNHNGNSLGYVLFDCKFDSNYHEMVQYIKSKLQLKVFPSIENRIKDH